MLFNSSTTNDKQEIKPQENKTFFCSELVAECYKIMGVLSREQASNQYWPGTFEKSNDKLDLLNGAYFEDIQYIDFD
jgi:hypothetical protein